MKIYVRVELAGVELADRKYEWRVVTANSISDGMTIASQMQDVVSVLEGSIIPGGVAT